MKITRAELIVWAPRILVLGLALFLSLFALDAFTENRGIAGAMVAFAMGLLPALAVLATVIVGWKHEGIAATVFAVLTVFYAATTLEHTAWIALVAAPLAIVGVFFFLSWRQKVKTQPPSVQSPSLPRS